ncbi:sporulation transcriptional regulator SpoIIID [Desulfitobacterium hafniense DP7]|uniref:Sporulation transcriptional regulator SpoIIID n=2 Tax=Desulfitobacterium hafniense TaxID=49338 RepID=Q24MR6_DESHY|nr:sporulation transcriptional regulator SpoIIID [Desulfitobacterium hafniense DP7]BAE86676.1 hypothetical protein DSY4887 [Desulfitobacterium hafniense Y51]
MSFLILSAYKCIKFRCKKGGLRVQEYIRKRVLDIGNYIMESSATVRQTADIFGVSKSTVHKDVTERLPLINEKLAMEVKQILESNKAERHIRGGEATRKKYQES